MLNKNQTTYLGLKEHRGTVISNNSDFDFVWVKFSRSRIPDYKSWVSKLIALRFGVGNNSKYHAWMCSNKLCVKICLRRSIYRPDLDLHLKYGNSRSENYRPRGTAKNCQVQVYAYRWPIGCTRNTTPSRAEKIMYKWTKIHVDKMPKNQSITITYDY